MPEPMVASVLCAPLLDGAPARLHVVHRASAAYQLADAHGTVRLCVAAASAIRLPHSVVVRRLPPQGGDVTIGARHLCWGERRYRPARWWSPARPALPALRPAIDTGAVDELIGSWRGRLGRGEGLTPYDDDVICGALVTVRAAGDPRASGWSRAVLSAPLERFTTATSAALLRLAARGWCIDPVAGYLTRLACGQDASAESATLRAVGSSSGRGLLTGITLVCAPSTSAAAA